MDILTEETPVVEVTQTNSLDVNSKGKGNLMTSYIDLTQLEKETNIMNYPNVDTGDIYPEMAKYIDSNGFTFDHKKEITVKEFEKVLTEDMHPIAHCVINEEKHFPKSRREFINGEEFEGKLIDYLKDSPYWEDEDAEWVYCITYDYHIVKIGQSISSLKKRYASYSCGTRRAMRKGSCSTTNYVITEANYHATREGMNVEIYGIRIPNEYVEVERFGETRSIRASLGRDMEEWVTDIFEKTTGHIPVLCVQKGNSSK
jgi:hypothetical protein